MDNSVKFAHLTLSVKTSQPSFISAFSGYVIFGEMQRSSYSNKSIVFKISDFIKLFQELKKVIEFFSFECNVASSSKHDNVDSCYQCLPKPSDNRKWEGKIANNLSTKSVTLFKSDICVCTLDETEFLNFIDCLLKIILYTFLFDETEVLFFQSLLEKHDIFIDCQYADIKLMEKFINKFSLLHNTNKLILKQLYSFYKEEIKCLFQFNLMFSG